ncbi:DUF4231 domain-containing protein [Streptomyces sp. RY43-2]|uniref:DUF4231 domain-containing protein n=1 Tax=Streptomyces macrolidinus TaxID=2952607 RepID=A0ABT0ZM19_9ACTN|nr:DUF4231 domain-containing protein [Streptomyces macrolidinus]MCN9244583.1 DUF4231 domain-containing protein [Streptomyces macrolidinus]
MSTPWRRFRVPALEEFLDVADDELDAAVEQYVQRLRHFYDARARWQRRGYRASGLVVIVVGALLPLLATSEFPGKELVLSLVGVTVSVVTALRSFYRFDQSWILLRNTEIAISDAYLKWKLARRRAAADPHSVEAEGTEGDTRALIDRIMRIRRDEAESFFNELPTPQPVPDGQSPVSLPTPRSRA